MSIPMKRAFGKKPAAVNIKRNFYTMASVDGDSAEITMYGDIVEEQPRDWWTDEPVEGQYIVESEFLEDLNAVAGCKKLTIRMDSLGGDAGVSILIHNRLRELAANGTELICIVDGVSMSGGSLIMCACDTVRVNPSSLVMIHKCWCIVWGGYNADELRQMANSNDAWDKSQVAIYKRKCGLSETVIAHMMAETTYMTGKEAVEKGFADELMEDAEPLNIAASADGRSLFVRGCEMHLTPGMFVPDNIPTVESGAAAPVKTNINQPAQTGGHEGGNTMAKTLEELRAENPELATQLMAEAQAAASAEATSTNTAAVEAERQRIADIDAIAGLFDDEAVHEAKYGEHPCTAQEMTYRAAQKAAKQGSQFLKDMAADNQASGAQKVPAAPGAETEVDDKDMTPNQRMTNARAEVADLLGKKKEGK